MTGRGEARIGGWDSQDKGAIDFKMVFSRYMNELNRRINKAKQDQIDLAQEVRGSCGWEGEILVGRRREGKDWGEDTQDEGRD